MTIACTLDGGRAALDRRAGEWRAVLARGTGRRATPGGLVVDFADDPEVTVELARLVAAEFACCSFLTFTLTVGPAGQSLAVEAPAEGRELLADVFGADGLT